MERMMSPADDIGRRHEKLVRITQSLIRHIEDLPGDSGVGYAQFQRAAVLEDEVRARTRDLEHALDLLNASNARLSDAYRDNDIARQNLSNAIEAVQEGFALFDASDVLIMCNSRFNALLPDIVEGLKPGLSFDDYLQLAAGSHHLQLPDGMSRDEWIAMRKHRHNERHFILTQGMADGRWVQVSEQRTPDGSTAIIQTEVTDLIRAEREERGRLLDDQTRILQATLDHAPLGVCIFDARLRLLGWNANLTEMLTLPRTRLRPGLHFDDLWHQLRAQFAFPPHQGANMLADWARSVRRKTSFEVEIRRRGGSGSFALFAQEIPDGGFVMSLDDITEHKNAMQAIRHANETLEARVLDRTLELEDALASAERANASRARFVAAVGHDLMQPLSAATLYVGSLLEEADDGGQRAKLEKTQRSLDSVSALLEALLDISRLEVGQAALTVEPIALGPLFRQLREEFTPIAEQKGLRLVVRPVEATVLSDRIYLRRILQNLISNAIRYTDRGRILVAARGRPGRQLIQVRDTGRGIAEKDQEIVFAEFKRLDAKASAAEGLGLGLAIVERAASLLGHMLNLRSAPGCGSTFSVEIASTGLGDRRDAEPADADGLAQQERAVDVTALLVENDAEVTSALSQLLEQWGVNVLDVTSGEDALELLEETGVEPDLCLVDYQLGAGMDGIACLSAIGRLLPNAPAKCLITADRSDALRQAADRHGIEILHKPITPATLARVVMPRIDSGRQPAS
ncbi:PAS-domain containing protein [Paracoccus sp. XHP0099]|uniref:histidine kinase n=1 Tax=Paracoccus marinaquae TaxID=2841926 RepID=A0ABS6AJU1_9RHOB|nr:PAS-domain containing protein [Paracoccus marinaquae]